MNISRVVTTTINGSVGYMTITDDGYGTVKFTAGYSDYRESESGSMVIKREDIQKMINALKAIMENDND